MSRAATSHALVVIVFSPVIACGFLAYFIYRGFLAGVDAADRLIEWMTYTP